MAKKRNLLGALVALGAVAAAAAAVYDRREEIRDLLNDAKERFCTCGDQTEDEAEGWEDGEGDLVIDITVEREPKKNEEDGGEN